MTRNEKRFSPGQITRGGRRTSQRRGKTQKICCLHLFKINHFLFSFRAGFATVPGKCTVESLSGR